MPHPYILPPSFRTPRALRARRMLLRAAGVLALLFCAFFVRYHFSWHFRGLFLLEGEGRYVFEVKDDLFLGEANRLLAGVDYGPVRRLLLHRGDEDAPGLHLDWEERDGSGYVRQVFPDGTILVTNFSRFVDDENKEVLGLFLGGALPEELRKGNQSNNSESGMTFYDGKRWHHVWCNMNEAIHSASERDPRRYSYPSGWRFLGSEVLRDGPHKVVLASRHATEVSGVPVRIERYAYFNAGEPFFRLSIRISNAGDRPVDFVYLYGDEPWVGNFGSSAGNVGWVQGGIVLTAGRIDPRKYRYAGFWDNGAPGDPVPPGGYTGTADFIEWLGPNVPDLVYFSNLPGLDPEQERRRVPLNSNTRFLGLAWGPRTLAPGEETAFFLAQGMAWRDEKLHVPVKPDVPLYAPLD